MSPTTAESERIKAIKNDLTNIGLAVLFKFCCDGIPLLLQRKYARLEAGYKNGLLVPGWQLSVKSSHSPLAHRSRCIQSFFTFLDACLVSFSHAWMRIIDDFLWIVARWAGAIHEYQADT